MAFMMPVVKNDWDIYNSQRSRKTSESTEKGVPGGRVRKVSESRSESAAWGGRGATLSPHRSAPAMRSLSYCRAPPSRASLRVDTISKGSASPKERPVQDKFHTRLVEKLKRALGRSDPRRDERTSWANRCLCAGLPSRPSAPRAAGPACPTCDCAEPSRERRNTVCDIPKVDPHPDECHSTALTASPDWNITCNPQWPPFLLHV